MVNIIHFFFFLFEEYKHSNILIIVIEENGVRLRLNIVDTPGYGDQVDNEDW